MRRKLVCDAVGALLSLNANAAPFIYNNVEIAGWATCCTTLLHPDTGSPVGANLFISFYSDGAGEALYAGGTLRRAATIASVSAPGSEPAFVGLADVALGGQVLGCRLPVRRQHGTPETR